MVFTHNLLSSFFLPIYGFTYVVFFISKDLNTNSSALLSKINYSFLLTNDLKREKLLKFKKSYQKFNNFFLNPQSLNNLNEFTEWGNFRQKVKQNNYKHSPSLNYNWNNILPEWNRFEDLDYDLNEYTNYHIKRIKFKPGYSKI